MIKEEIIDLVRDDTGYGKIAISEILESLLTNITDALSDGEKVQFSGFGTFEPKHRAARTGRNPHTGKEVPIPARILPTFKPGKSLREAVEKELVE